MRSDGMFEVKTKLSELLRLGEPIEITSHRKRVAIIHPNHTPLDSVQVKRDIKALNKADKQDDTADMGDYLWPRLNGRQ